MKLAKEKVLALGFKELPHFTIMDSLVYDLGRNRLLSLGDVGSPNEIMYIGQLIDFEDGYDDLVCIHNYDYDGYLTEEKLSLLLTFFAENKK